MSPSYAIVESGGKQYRVEKGTRFLVDRVAAGEGDKVSLRALAFSDNGNLIIDAGELEKAKVEAVVADHLRGPKLRIFKYRAKKGYRRRAGHRSELTRLEVTELKMLSRKPAAGRQQAADGKQKPKAADAKAEAKAADAKAEAETKPKPKPKGRTSAQRKSSGQRKGSTQRSTSRTRKTSGTKTEKKD
jgi:large subunit ribosomal protein L21